MDTLLNQRRQMFNPGLQMCANVMEFARAAALRRQARIATLGPCGTSSEYVASCFSRNMELAESRPSLYASYEEAAESVIGGENDLLLVANAYANINRFYISETLSLTTLFVLDTPSYGLASLIPLEELMRKDEVVISTHPAPAHLAKSFMSGFQGEIKIEVALSTSEAARRAASREVDACITNDQARALHGLDFISPVRPIQMVWSVFKNRGDMSFPNFNSLPGILENEIRTHN
ncbi:MAG TPA: hypothetical protein VIG66_03715 [Noviherbaspirillum sp.]